MRYGSICSGIEAATVAWHPLGWEPAWFAEIAPFPSAVLAHHYPTVENLGDFTRIGPERGPIDLLVGGTPCQSFSVAGRRGGLDDPRGVLAFEFLRLADRLRPAWVVFENVPGLLSSDEGRDFGAFLGALGECGYGWAYRVLDAQYFGVAQRRERVFVVGSLGDWRRAAAVLLEPSCLRTDGGGVSGRNRTVRIYTPRGKYQISARTIRWKSGRPLPKPGETVLLDMAPTYMAMVSVETVGENRCVKSKFLRSFTRTAATTERRRGSAGAV